MIRKKLLKFTAITFLGVMSTGITAFAETGEFNFSIPAGKDEWSSILEKADSEQNWYATPTFYALKEDDYVRLTVYSADKKTAYTTLKANDTKRYVVPYSSSKPAKATKKYVLRGRCPADKTSGGVTMSGRWTP